MKALDIQHRRVGSIRFKQDDRQTTPRISAALLIALAMAGQGVPAVANSDFVVNSLADDAAPPAGTVTLRSALAMAASGRTIVFDKSLNGGTIELSITGNEHSQLKAEVVGMADTPSGPVSYLVSLQKRSINSAPQDPPTLVATSGRVSMIPLPC